jgi:hypothetical protein
VEVGPGQDLPKPFPAVLEKMLKSYDNPLISDFVFSSIMHRFPGKTIADIEWKINKVEFFMQNAERYHLLKEPMNIYSSLAHLPNMPMFSFRIPRHLTVV